jgi:hypothetical protein
MPIEHRIDRERRVVFAAGHGVFSDQDVFEYQRGVWSDPSLVGYDEVVDMSDVTEVSMPSAMRARDLAVVAARMDSPGTASRLAIVAPADFAYGLARMYASYRALQQEGTKTVRVFRAMDEAIAWLEGRLTE